MPGKKRAARCSASGRPNAFDGGTYQPRSVEPSGKSSADSEKCKTTVIQNSDRSAVRLPPEVETVGGRSAWVEKEGLQVVDSLPCLFSNNSNENEKISGSEEPDFEQIDARFKALQNLDRKRAFALGENCRYFIEKHGIERIGFLTLTFLAMIVDPKEAQAMFNSLATGVLRPMFGDYVRVIEPHRKKRRGAIHYHLLVACPCDIRTGFDFDAIRRRDYRSASPGLRSIWARLRNRLPGYGFGRSELLPIKSTAEGAARYVGKYLGKSRSIRAGDTDGVSWKGVRTVQYSQGWRPVSLRFAWWEGKEGGARDWRDLCDAIGRRLEVDETEGLASVLGKRWSWKVIATRIAYPEGSHREIADILAAFVIPEGKR